MAETEVSKEVTTTVAIDEKCGLDMSPYQDLPKPDRNGTGDHSQANDLDNSYVFVTGADGLSDDAVATSKHVEAEGSSGLPECEAVRVKDQGAKLESQNEPLNDAENRNVEQSNGGPALVNDGSTSKHESSHEDGEGVRVSVADAEAEGSSNLPEFEAVRGRDQGAELESQNEKFAVVSGELQPLNEVENRNVEQSKGCLTLVNDSSTLNHESPHEDGKGVPVSVADVEAEGSSVLPEFEAVRVRDQGAELDSQIRGEFQPLNAAENRNIEQSNGDATLVNYNTSKHESSHEDGERVQVSVTDSLEEHTGKTESAAEAEVKRVEDPDGKIENLAEAEVEKAPDQSGKVEGVAFSEQEKFNDVIKPESSPGPVENQESLFGALRLVAESGESGESNNLHINSSHSANDESVNKSNLSITEALEACQGSQDTVVDVVECELQDVSVDAEDEVKSAREAAKAVEHEVSPSTSLDLDLESYPVHSKDETLEEEAKTTLSLDVLENQQDDTADGNNVQGVLGQIDESTTVLTTDCDVQNVFDLVSEEKNEDSSPSEVDNGVQYPEEPDQQPPGCGVSEDTMPSETKAQTSVQILSYPASNAHAPQSEIEIFSAEPIGVVSSPPTQSPKSQIIEEVFSGHDSRIRCPSKEASSGSDSTLDTVVLAEMETTSEAGEPHTETEVSSQKAKVADSPPATFDVKLKPEVHVHDFSAVSSGEKTDDVAASCRTEVSDSFNVNKNCADDIMSDVDGIQGMGDQLDGAAENNNENLFVQENEDTGNFHSTEISVASAPGSSANIVDGEEESIKTKTKPFNFLIRIPRFDDEILREQIKLAKLQVDEKTILRDAIQVQIQEKRANSQIHGIDYEYAKGEGRNARKLVRSKRMEIDSLQSVINKAKNALSIEDIDSQIYNMEHMIQHETLPLKEEKQLIREIKQLKQLREQLSSNMGSQDEIKQALEQREEVEERLKILRKELDILKNRVLKAEATAAEAEKKYDNENKKVKELQAQFRAADDVRQAAYAQWQNLRKELSKKSQHFFKYKDDAAVAGNYVFSRNTEALYHLCMNQVENFMELWNTNYEFRRDYVKFNARNTVRRLGTLDGRSLGPDEEPPILPSYADERVNRMASTPGKVDLASKIPTVELKQETTNENGTLDGKPMMKVTEPKNQKVTKGPAVTVEANGLDTLSSRELIDEVYEEPPIKKTEEIESIRKEEEMRREEAEAKLKEQRRLEALAKANEARERKKRQAEKLQLRAELKTQKEAEQKEKEREKRLRKKERKKAAVTDANDSNNNCETAPSSESTVESSKDLEVKDIPPVAPKKPQKPWLFAKQSKAKSIPPPLRNRNKKKWQQWMWVGITSFIILVLFWLGNVGVFSNAALKRRGPVH